MVNRQQMINSWVAWIALALAIETPRAATWEPVTALNYPRAGFAAGVAGGKICVAGGYDANGNEVSYPEVLDLANASAWVAMTPRGQDRLLGASLSTSGTILSDKLLVVTTLNATPISTIVDQYDLQNDTWTKLSDRQTNRTTATVFSYANRIWLLENVYVGQAGSIRLKSQTLEHYRPVVDTWGNGGKVIKPKESQAVAIVSDTVYFLGGIDRYGHSSNAIVAFNAKSRKWHNIALAAMPTPRAFPKGQTAPVIDGKIYLIGGEFSSESGVVASDKVEIYDPASDTWQLGPSLPQGLSAHASLATDNTLYVIGGKTSDGSVVSGVWRIAGTWKTALSHEQTYDLNGDGVFSDHDVALFVRACRRQVAYWQCDLTNDGRFNRKDTDLHRVAFRNDDDGALARAYIHQQSNVQLAGQGSVIKVLADDLNGNRHQRFIIRTPWGQTLLIAHNIDIAPRLDNLKVGSSISFYGEYEWNLEGGVIHWTHHDPNGSHIDGWIKWKGKTYQ